MKLKTPKPPENCETVRERTRTLFAPKSVIKTAKNQEFGMVAEEGLEPPTRGL
jgi:hypothetical protein